MKNSYETYSPSDHLPRSIPPASEKYKLLIDHSLSAFFLTSPEGNIVESNAAAAGMFGYRTDEFKTINSKDILDHTNIDLSATLPLQEATDTKWLEGTGIKKNGERFPVEILSAVFTNENGELKTSLLITDLSEQKKSAKDLKQVLDSITDGFFTIDSKGIVKYWNSGAEKITGIRSNIITGQIFRNFYSKVKKNASYANYESALRNKQPVHFEEYFDAGNIWLEVNIYPSGAGLSIFFKDITETRRLRELERIEKEVLENNAHTNSKLEDTLSYYLTEIEKVHRGMLCSVLQLRGNQLYNWAAPSLPEAYCTAIEGAAIGDNVGSCGTAAFKKEKVIVTDIEHDTRWADYKTYALKEGLRACWSFPILNSKEQVLGTFAIYYKEIKSPTREEEKTIERARNIILVILENKIAEAAMRLSNERYDMVVKATNDLVWDWNLLTGTIDRSGHGLSEVYGHSKNEDIDTLEKWCNFLHPLDKDAVVEKIQYIAASKTASSFRLEYRFKKEDGNYNYINDRGYIIRNESGDAVRMIGAAEDITERKKAEQAIEESEERYRYLFNNNPSSIIIWDIDDLKIIEANETAIELYGYAKEDLLSMSILDIYATKEREAFTEMVMQAKQNGQFIKPLRWQQATKGGAKIISEVFLHTIIYNGKKTVLSLSNNVSEKIQLENSLIEERKIRQKQITDAVITGQEKERVEIGQELHDNINQILATTKLYLECALAQKYFRHKLVKESKQLTEKAMQEIRNLSNSLIPPSLEEIGLIEALRDLTDNIRSVNTLKIVTNWKGFNERLLNKKLKLTIFRIVQEQLNNIIKHAHASQAKISITKKENEVWLCVEDDGIGFDTSTRRNGVGIKNIISRSEVNNGKVSILSKPGQGCIITVCFAIPDPVNT